MELKTIYGNGRDHQFVLHVDGITGAAKGSYVTPILFGGFAA